MSEKRKENKTWAPKEIWATYLRAVCLLSKLQFIEKKKK